MPVDIKRSKQVFNWIITHTIFYSILVLFVIATKLDTIFRNKVKTMEELKPHIHCPNCLEGILEMKVHNYSEGNYVYRCNICYLIFKRENLGKLELVFKDNANDQTKKSR